jgi:hypothetical protein
MRTTYTGSCHCGAVRFEADIDLAQPTYRCNCSICSRTRFWPAIVSPGDIRILAGESELTEYRFHSKHNAHQFCRTCGVRPWGIGALPDGTAIYGVNIGCLENVAPDVLAAAPIVYVDGAHDRFEPPPITAYL